MDSGETRGWVSRYFRLIPGANALAYLQRQGETLSEARGIVPLSSYVRVEEAPDPDDKLHGFKLVHATGATERSLLLAASTAEERRAWMSYLVDALAAAAAAALPVSSRSCWRSLCSW